MSDLRTLIVKQQAKISDLEAKIRKLQAENIENLSSKEVYEKSLRENQDLIRALFDDAGFGMLLLDLQGYIVRINKLTSDITGYRTDEILGKRFFDLVKNYSSNKSKKLFKRLIESDRLSENFHRKFYRKDGTPRWLKINTVLFNDLSDRPQAVFVLLEDITPKKQADKLRSILYQIARFSNQSNSLEDLIVFIRKEMQKIFNTKNVFLELYDNELAEYKTNNTTKTIKRTPQYKSLEGYVYRTKCAQVLSEEEIENLSSRNEVTIESTMPKLWVGLPLIINDNVLGLIGVKDYEFKNKYNIKDIDILDFLSGQISFFIERQKYQEKLSIEEKLFRNLFTNYPGAIALIDKDSVIKRINKGFTDLLGYQSDEIISLPLSTLIENESQLDLFNLIGFNALNNNPIRKDTTIKDIYGEKVDVIIKSGSITDLPDYAFIIFEDIRSRKNYEYVLKDAKKRAEESDSLKSAFLSNLTSEIRTPLNAIVGFSNLLSANQNISEDDRLKYSENIEKSSDSLVNLVNNLLDISLIDAEQFNFDNKTFNPLEILESSYRLFEAKLEDLNIQKIKLTLNKEIKDDCLIFGDQERFYQAINQLIDNAIKFTSEGNIEIGVKEIENNLRFYVKDEGPGVDDHNHEVIFQRFIKISPDKKRIYKGTGIGLYISQAIIKNLGGRIEVISSPNKGSEFFFTIPKAYHEKFKNIDNKSINEIPLDLKNKTVLIVEDITSNFKYLQAVLMKYKPNIIWAKTGLEAIEYLENKTPIDMILMDLHLPDINGLELTYRYKKENKNLPIIAQTAYTFDEAKENIYSIGCDEYLTKPINPKQLIETIYKLLNNEVGI